MYFNTGNNYGNDKAISNNNYFSSSSSSFLSAKNNQSSSSSSSSNGDEQNNNSISVEDVYIIDGEMFQIMGNLNEYTWSGTGIIKFLCNSIDGKKVEQQRGGVFIDVRGNFGMFDRFLEFSLIVRKSTNEFIKWNRVPKPKQFSPQLFAEMLFYYSPLCYDLDEAYCQACVILSDFICEKRVDENIRRMIKIRDARSRRNKRISSYNNNNNLEREKKKKRRGRKRKREEEKNDRILKIYRNGDNLNFDLKRLSQNEFIKQRVNRYTVYFYYVAFIELLRIYPKKYKQIRLLNSDLRLKIYNLFKDDLEALCYTYSSKLPYNPLGRLSKKNVVNYTRYSTLSEDRKNQNYKFSERVNYYEVNFISKYLNAPKNLTSTRILLNSKEISNIRSSRHYKILFKIRKALFLKDMPFNVNCLDKPKSRKTHGKFLIDRVSLVYCDIIVNKINSILEKSNPMPPLPIRKIQYIKKLGGKDRLPYIMTFHEYDSKMSDDELGKMNLETSQFTDDTDLNPILQKHSNLSPWETYQKSSLNKVSLRKELHKNQWKSIELTINQPLVLISGGPGRGKTSKVLTNIWKSRQIEYLIVARDGVAVDKIIQEINKFRKSSSPSTFSSFSSSSSSSSNLKGIPSPTCSNLSYELKSYKNYSQSSNEKEFYCEPHATTIDYVIKLLTHQPNNLIRFTTGLIIDESSCIDEMKFAQLLTCLPYLQQLVMIGDVDQMSPIGKGYPFRDLLTSFDNLFCRLTKNFRSESVQLITNAEHILSSKIGEFSYSKIKQVKELTHTTLLERSGDIVYDVVSIVKHIESVIGKIKSRDVIQFITPFNKTRKAICSILYNHWFQFQQTKTLRHFSIGQKVVFLKNYGSVVISNGNKSSDVKNGEVGIILSIYDTKMKINRSKNVPDRYEYENTHKVGTIPRKGYRRWLRVKTLSGKTKNIDLITIDNNVVDGSCITGHKSQGSEYPIVVIVLDFFKKSCSHIVNRNWLYTSYTRARQSVFVLYTKQQVSSKYSQYRELGSFCEIMMTKRPKIDTFLGLQFKKK